MMNSESIISIQINNSNNRCNESSPESFKFLLNITDIILIVYPWVMILFGTFSNIITFIVITKSKLRKSSTFFYLACLSIIDLVQIYTFCINFIFYYQFKIDLQRLFCNVYSFLIYFLPQFSAWTCVAVSLDRVIGVIFSVRGRYASTAKKCNTPKVAFIVMIVIFACLFLINLQFFFYSNEYDFSKIEIVEDVNVIYCSPENIKRFQKFYSIWVYIDLSINVLIPFAVMIISSIIIVIGILKSTRNLNRNLLTQSSVHKSVDERSNSIHTNFKASQSSNTTSGNKDPLLRSRKSINFVKRASTVFSINVSNKAKSVSFMLATNNIVFISLTLPIVVFLSMFSDPTDICNYEKAKLRLIKVICIILMNTNCAINIFIYSFMASEFRHQLIALLNKTFFCCSKPKLNRNDTQLTKSLKTTRHPSSENHDSQSKRS